jgi:asparagine synthase (glutamine-hydrolysing)
VAEHLGTEHTELYVTGEDALGVIPQLPEIYDEPFADSSQIPTLLVSALARRDVTVALSGDGGDELFGGYPRHWWGITRGRLHGLPGPLRQVLSGALTHTPDAMWDGVFRLAAPLVPRRYATKALSVRARQLARLLAMPDADAMYGALTGQWGDGVPVLDGGPELPFAVTNPWSAGASDFTQRMLFLDLVTYLADDILAKVDRASMAVSLEVRVPLLDPAIIAFAWQLPLGMKLRAGRGKWLLRQLLARHVPNELIERPKMGFSIPLAQWLRRPLREWAEALLDPTVLRQEGLLAVAPIRAKWAEHLAGSHDWHLELWSVLMFRSWMETARSRARAGSPPRRTILHAAAG